MHLVGADTNPAHLVSASVLCDSFVQIPPWDAPGFRAALTSVIEREEIGIYAPFLDAELALAAELHESGAWPTTWVVAPSAGVARICLDKWQAARWLEAHDIDGPPTWLASDALPGGPFFYKPRAGNGSRGARRVASLAELDPTERELGIVQTPCAAPEVTVDAFYAPETGVLATLARERLETKSGVATKARLFHSPPLEALALRLAQALPLPGTFCFQVMTHEGRPVVTDINPRPGAATAMSVAVGMDFFGASFARARGEDPRPAFRKLSGEAFVTRQYCEFVSRRETTSEDRRA